MSTKSRRAKWFSGWGKRQKPLNRPQCSVEEQEFFVETDLAELGPVGRNQPKLVPSGVQRVPGQAVQRFEQPEFSDVGRANGLGPSTTQAIPPARSSGHKSGQAASQSAPQTARQRPVRAMRQQVRQILLSRYQSSQQAAIVGTKRLTRFAQSQAHNLYEWAKPFARQHRLSLLSLGLLSTASVTAIGAMIWLSRVPPTPECNRINLLSSDSERLYCAQQAAQSGNLDQLLAAMALVKSWAPDNPLYPQATAALGQWSEMLLLEARDRLSKNDLDGAIRLAKQIPDTSPIFEQVQQEVTFWQVERNRGQKLFERIQTAFRKQRWNDASDLLAKLALVDDASWQNRLPNLRKQLVDEKKAGQLLKQARNFAAKNSLEKRGNAIRILLPINRQTIVWEVASQQIQQWRDQLLKQAAVLLQQNQIQSANRLIATLPPEVEITEVQRDLTRVAQVAAIDTSKQNNAPLLNQLWGLMMADTAVQQVATTSPYYKQAQQLLPRLEMQAEDAMQIELAQAIARFGQLPALGLAMHQVEQIEMQRPRRIQAQTLLAHWRKKTQILEDRPVLQQAQLWAQAGERDQLRTAVQLVEQIAPGRAIYATAQQNKRSWITQIQTIEDQPILDKARNVAQSGRLSEAIRLADQIKSGRALYQQAQVDISGWAAELQVIADRDRLARANALAAEGSLTRAINLADQINSRAVYGEAQQLITQWKAEREEFWRAQQQEQQQEQQPDIPEFAPSPPVAESPEPEESAPLPPQTDPEPPQ